MEKELTNKYVRWHKHQFSRRQKIIFLVILGMFFLILLPLILLLISQRLDTFLPFSKVLPAPLNFCLAPLFFIVGFLLSFWAVWVQFHIGHGTPAPMMPTQKLVIKAPYTLCRNPMGLGTGILYIGFGLFFNSLSFILLNILLFICFFLYYKFIEEKELVARFGEEYLEYKNRTAFLIPTFGRKKYK